MDETTHEARSPEDESPEDDAGPDDPLDAGSPELALGPPEEPPRIDSDLVGTGEPGRHRPRDREAGDDASAPDDLPPRLREAIARILESGEIGAERVARLLVGVFRILRRLEEAIAEDERDAAADPARSGAAAEPSPSDAGAQGGAGDDDGLPIAVRESIAGLLEGRETVAEYVARALARIEDTAQQADDHDLDDDVAIVDGVEGGVHDPVAEDLDLADGGAAESSAHIGDECDPGAPTTEPADPGARGETEGADVASPGDRLAPPPLDGLPPRTRALVERVLACGRPGSVEVAHALVDLYHTSLGIGEGAGPAPDGEAGALGENGALGPSDPGGGEDAPLADLPLPADLPPRLRRFLEELSASGHPAAASIVRAATRLSEAMRRCPGLPPAPFDQDLEPGDQEPEALDAADLEPEDTQPEDLVIQDTVPLEAASEGLPPDCLGYLHVKTEFRLEGGLFALATRSPEVVVGALRAMVRRATDRMLGAAAGELLDHVPPGLRGSSAARGSVPVRLGRGPVRGTTDKCVFASGSPPWPARGLAEGGPPGSHLEARTLSRMTSTDGGGECATPFRGRPVIRGGRDVRPGRRQRCRELRARMDESSWERASRCPVLAAVAEPSDGSVRAAPARAVRGKSPGSERGFPLSHAETLRASRAPGL